MKHTVQRGDSLVSISEHYFDDKNYWYAIALQNQITAPFTLYIGQDLVLPNHTDPLLYKHAQLNPQEPRQGASLGYARGFFFVLADEILPSGKIVRKVLQYPTTLQQSILANPEAFGIKAPNPGVTISLGDHALGNNFSQYTSGSTLPKGAPNIAGRPVYIDIAKAKRAGVIIHSTEDIIKDLDRIAATNPQMKSRIGTLKNAILNVEKEVLMQGDIPASAIKSARSMQITRGLRAVQFIGFAITAYDLGMATKKSIEKESPKPIVAEGIRQVGGWGGALVGIKVGGVAGAAIGIETGPGAIVTGAAGAIIFGTAGYFGFDWVADFIDEN